MAWRRDETWLDADVVWLREPSDEGAALFETHAPSFWKLTAEALEAKIPDGLAESRRRRADRRRRRSTRRTRAAALMVSPTMVLSLAGPRPGGAARPTEALAEDPPSQTLRVPTTERKATAAPDPARADDEKLPAIGWARADSHGLPYAGRLSSGTTLPVEGPDWVTWNPVRDDVPNRPHRLYGHERTIRAILTVSAAYRAANPDAPRVVVGDISFRDGGPMELHRSHQNGLDVDVYYPRRDGVERAPLGRRQIHRALTQDLLDRFLAAGADVIFVGYSLGLAGPNDRVVPYPNHEDHMHVRFRSPSD